MKDRLGEDVFKELKKFEISYFQGDDADTLVAYNTDTRFLKINGRFYGLLANKELAENTKKQFHSMFTVAITHDLFHYHIRESGFKYSEEYKEIVKFYEENEEVILKVFPFIKKKAIKKNIKGETYKEDVYSEEQRPEEFIVEAIAYLEAGFLNEKSKNPDHIKIYNFAQKKYNSLKRSKK